MRQYKKHFTLAVYFCGMNCSFRVEKATLVNEGLTAQVKTEQGYVQETLVQLEAARTLATQLERDLQKEKEYGLELVTDKKEHKSRAHTLEAENRNCTAQVSALKQMLSNKTQDILLLTAQLEARKAETVTEVPPSDRCPQEQLRAAVSFRNVSDCMSLKYLTLSMVSIFSKYSI
jgi:seryl-tRNA synthetase